MPMMKLIRIGMLSALGLLALAMLSTASLAKDSSLAGTWTGTVENPSLKFSLTVKGPKDRLELRLNMASNGIENLKLDQVKFDGETLEFVVPVPDQVIRCKAKRKEDGSFAGTYFIGDQSGGFTMARESKTR